MLPCECTCLAVEREYVVIAGGDVEDAVFDNRSAFKRILLAEARAQVRYPGALEVLDVAAVDLGQRRIARVVPIAADRKPVLAGWLAQVGSTLRKAGRWADRVADCNDKSQANPTHAPLPVIYNMDLSKSVSRSRASALRSLPDAQPVDCFCGQRGAIREQTCSPRIGG
jgi:hypothetical protein